MYEIMRSLYQVSELKEELKPTEYILKAMYQNAWLSTRPEWEQKRLVKTEGQPWAQGVKFGSHRIQQEWIEHDSGHMDAEFSLKAQNAS